MSGRLHDWWLARSPREHGLLILLALIAMPTLLWYGAIMPLDRAIERAQQARDADADMLADVLRMAGRIRGAERPTGVRTPIEALVRTEAERAGFTVATVARNGEGALLTIDAVRSQPFFAWVAAMRQRHGLIVMRMTARPNADASLSISMTYARAR